MSHLLRNVFIIFALVIVAPSYAATAIGTGPANAPSESEAAKSAAQAATANIVYVPVSSMQSAGGSGVRTVPATTFTPVDTQKTIDCPGP